MADAPPAPPPPPPPPPMPGSGVLPTVKLNSEIGRSGPPPSSGGGKHLPGGGAPFSYIPPAAIQNAMATKDKKPFTYTPGGIDFLAEIRSPRMQRRISKNAMDEGVSHGPPPPPPPPPQQQSPAQLSPQALAAMQPQMAVPVFPITPESLRTASLNHVQHAPQPPPPPQPAALRVSLKPAVPQFLTQHSPQPQTTPQHFDKDVPEKESRPTPQPAVAHDPPPPPPAPPAPSRAAEKAPSTPATSTPVPPPPAPPRAVERAPSTPVPSTATPPAPAPSRAVDKAPSTPSPSSEPRSQLGSIYVPPVMSGPSAPQSPAVIPSVQLSKAPMPWMSSQGRSSSSTTPPYVNPQPVERVIQMTRDEDKPAPQHAQSAPSNVRVIPIAVEGRPSPPAAKKEESKKEEVKKEEVQLPWLTTPGKIVPIHLEGCTPAAPVQQRPAPVQQHQEQPPWRTQAAANANQIAAMMEELMSPTATAPRPNSQPTQSRSFRILQMIHDPADDEADQVDGSGRLSRCSVGSNTSTGSGGRMSNHGPPPPGERKLHLTQDDRELMDMFKSQVNEDSSLHQESDPRYRGSHIPSRAFRILQNFTAEAANEGTQEGQQRTSSYSPSVGSSHGASPARSRGPPSEQNEAEPRKYMGANIPSRSFRMLQAMTSSDPNEGQSEL